MQIPTRTSRSAAINPQLDEIKEFSGDNIAFVTAALKILSDHQSAPRQLYFVLVGSRDLLGNALRRAQSVLRRDLRPSLWSHAFAFVLPAGKAPVAGRIKVRGVPLDTRNFRLPEPAWNGVTETLLEVYANPERDANLAVISVALTEEESARVIDRFYSPNADRVRYDLWNSLCRWQRFYWAFGSDANPLQEGVPMPSSHFIEHCYDAIQLDLNPGSSERASAPEFLWSTVKYWHEALADRKNAIKGVYTIRDPGCTILPPYFGDAPSSATIEKSSAPRKAKRGDKPAAPK